MVARLGDALAAAGARRRAELAGVERGSGAGRGRPGVEEPGGGRREALGPFKRPPSRPQPPGLAPALSRPPAWPTQPYPAERSAGHAGGLRSSASR